MGYNTEFQGEFKLDKPLDPETKTFLEKLSTTRRMKRNLPPEYGVEGEFYVDGEGYFGQDKDSSLIDYNRPPSTQPGLWCKWEPTEDGTAIVWNGAEKFYDYVEWLEYLILKILAPKGYTLNGNMRWRGEEFDDMGTIIVKNNKITAVRL